MQATTAAYFDQGGPDVEVIRRHDARIRSTANLTFSMPHLTASAQSRPYLAWDDSATYGTAAWLPQAEPGSIRATTPNASSPAP